MTAVEFLPLDVVRAREAEVRRALDDLLRSRTVAARPRARQWRFFRACVDRLFHDQASEFDRMPGKQAAQLKVEVQSRLRRAVASRDGGLELNLVHRRELVRRGFAEAATYPALAGYCLVVRDSTDALLAPAGLSRAYLERVVVEACDSEFHAYATIPEIALERLERWFHPEGPAYDRIAERLDRVKAAGYTLNNALNPSYHQVRAVHVKPQGRDRALARTTEYWHLAWWHPASRAYLHIFDEATRQTYDLRRDAHGWRVFENVQPPTKARRRGPTVTQVHGRTP